MPGRQLGSIFAQMCASCPVEISTYGKCASSNLPESMEQNHCAKEFRALQKCFQKVRKKVKVVR